MTYSNLNALNLKKESLTHQLHVHTLNIKGTEFFKSEIIHFLKNKHQHFLLILFKNQKDMSHFEYITHTIDSIQKENIKKNKSISKALILIYQKTYLSGTQYTNKTDFNWRIELRKKQDWRYLVIENLANSFYR